MSDSVEVSVQRPQNITIGPTQGDNCSLTTFWGGEKGSLVQLTVGGQHKEHYQYVALDLIQLKELRDLCNFILEEPTHSLSSHPKSLDW